MPTFARDRLTAATLGIDDPRLSPCRPQVGFPRLRQPTATQSLLTADVCALVAAQRSAEHRLGELDGDSPERRYREWAASLFQQILARIRVVDHQDLGLLLDDAVETGTSP